MDGGAAPRCASIETGDLGRLMPMHLWVSDGGVIRAAGPTLNKLTARSLAGRRFLDVFAILRPERVASISDALRLCGHRLHLELREPPNTGFRGLAVALPDRQGMLFNLSFGIAAADAVRRHSLSNADFAPTDLTVELLYLTEVKAAVMSELAALNQRLQDSRREAEAQALTDPLTGLANRRAFERGLAEAVDTARRGRGFVLMHLDLDYFKTVNDTLGHAAGDHVLAEVAHALRAETRRSDLVARIGGDEFVLILRGGLDADRALRLAQRIIARLECPIEYEGKPCRVSASCGLVLSADYDEVRGEQLLADADAALYSAKRQGKGRAVLQRAGGLREDQRDPA